MPRKKLNLIEIKKSLEMRNVDDGRPWFLTRRILPPEFVEVKICWDDSASEMAMRDGNKWIFYSRFPEMNARANVPPVGWKPWGGQGMTVSDTPVRALPDPLAYGIQITPGDYSPLRSPTRFELHN